MSGEDGRRTGGCRLPPLRSCLGGSRGGAPVKLLDALSRGVPTVAMCRATGGLRVAGAAEVVDNRPNGVAQGIERVLADEAYQETLRTAGSSVHTYISCTGIRFMPVRCDLLQHGSAFDVCGASSPHALGAVDDGLSCRSSAPAEHDAAFATPRTIALAAVGAFGRVLACRLRSACAERLGGARQRSPIRCSRVGGRAGRTRGRPTR